MMETRIHVPKFFFSSQTAIFFYNPERLIIILHRQYMLIILILLLIVHFFNFFVSRTCEDMVCGGLEVLRDKRMDRGWLWGQVRLGQVRLGQVRLGQVRLGQVRSKVRLRFECRGKQKNKHYLYKQQFLLSPKLFLGPI